MKLPETPEEIEKAFTALGEAQRGAPEDAMMDVYTVMSSEYAWSLEHVGDLNWRNTTMWEGRLADIDEGMWKIKQTNKSLHKQYGGKNDFDAKINRDIEYTAKSTGKTVDEVESELRAAGQKYADEHRKLTVYNEIQILSKEAAIALGEWRFDDARTHLAKLQGYVDEGKEAFTARASRVEAAQPPAALSDTTRPKHPKLFDESGEPRVVYRGISEQKKDAPSKKPSPNRMMFGEGSYFALKPDRSASYGNVGTYKLYIDNPMEFYSKTTDAELSRWVDSMNQNGVDSGEVISAIRAKEPFLTNGAIYSALGGSKFWGKDVSIEQLRKAKSIAIGAGFDSVLVSQGSSGKARLNDEVVVFDQSKIEKIGDLNDR